MDIDEEYIYPYWKNIFPNKTLREKAFDWNSPIWSKIIKIKVDRNIAHYLRRYEQTSQSTKGKAHFASLCGRYYEAVFNEYYGTGSIIEGAPVDGITNEKFRYKHKLNFEPFLDKYWMLNINSYKGKIWEMKKLRRSTGKCHFNKQNIDAILHLKEGYLIGATISDVKDEIIYKIALLTVNT